MFPSCSTGPQSPFLPVCQMQLVTEHGKVRELMQALRPELQRTKWQKLAVELSCSLQEP